MSGSAKTIIVTGASRAIGAATARLAASRGYAVCVNYRANAAQAEAVAESIKAAGGKAITVQADVGLENDVVRMFKEVDRAFGRLDGLVNNAGVSGGRSPVMDISAAVLQEVFATNVFGCFLCAREALKRMSLANGGVGGAIVNVSSQAASFGGDHIAHYAASKAAVNAFTIGFAREAAALGVRVNAVSPGIIDTDQIKDTPPELMAQRLSSIPMGRMGTSAEVAEAILWLLSDAASYISGAILPVHGAR